MVEYHLFSACPDCISLVRKSYQVYSLDLHYAGRVWIGDILVADIEEFEKMDASEIHVKRLNAKEVFTSMNGEKFIFPITDGTAKLSGGNQVLGTSTLILDRPDRGQGQGNLPGESDGSSSNPFQDSSLYGGDARNDFWSISGNLIYRRYAEPRVKLYVVREASFPNPRNYIDVTRTTDTSLDVMLEKNIDDYWDVGGHQMDIHGPGGDRQESKRPPDQTLCVQKFGKICRKVMMSPSYHSPSKRQ